MKAKSNLPLRRVKNRKRFKRMAITGFLSIPSSISDSAMLSLKKAWQNRYQDAREYMPFPYSKLDIDLPSSLPGYHWVRKPNPNDGTGFSWYEEKILND